MRDGYQSAVDVSGLDSFEVHARASSDDFAGRLSANGFVQFGIEIGAGGMDDFVKFVISDGGTGTPRVQLANNQSLTTGLDLNYSIGGPGPDVDLPLVGDIDFRIIVDRVAGSVVGQIDFFALADGAPLTSFTTPAATILADSAFDLAMQGLNPLTGGTGGLAYGINVTDSGGSNDPNNGNFNQITVDYDFLTIRALDEIVNEAPTAVTLTPVLTEIAEDADVTARIKVADIAVTDDALGTNLLATTGADADLFEIDGTELFLKAGTALDFETRASLDVAVTVDDEDAGGTPDATSAPLTLTVTDVNEAPSLTVTPVLTAIAEDADTAAATIVATIAVTDDVWRQ